MIVIKFNIISYFMGKKTGKDSVSSAQKFDVGKYVRPGLIGP